MADQQDQEQELRQHVRKARRIVVKVGSSSITYPGGGINHPAISRLVSVLAKRRYAGSEVLLVSSGAIAAGMASLNMTSRPTDLPGMQAAASVGQSQLASAYSLLFRGLGLTAGQVLLTTRDVTRRTTYLNGRSTLEKLLELGAVPVINENDTVATRGIRFGDNDRLAALVAHLVNADALVLLSDVDGLYTAPPSEPGSEHISLMPDVSTMEGVDVGGSGSAVGTGGMQTKIESARIATAAGIPTLLTSTEYVDDALGDATTGTIFAPTGQRSSARRLWLKHATEAAGRIIIDDGAVRAVCKEGRSLLHAGVVGTEGKFLSGDAVELVDERGKVVARGLVNYDVADVQRAMGESTKVLREELGSSFERSLVHRDHMVIM